jgi:hypothetical protein
MRILERLGLTTPKPRRAEQHYAERDRQPRKRVLAVESSFGEDGYLVKPSRSFTGLINQYSRVYSDRWDEALRQFPRNAIAMENDAYFGALMDERTQPLRRWKWHIDHVDDPDQKSDPEAENIRKQLGAIIARTYRFAEMRDYLRDGVWFGRYGSQLQRVKKTIGGYQRWVIQEHTPVHGDSIRRDYDGNWCVAINSQDMPEYGDEATVTDKMPVLRLRRSDYRQRFVLHRRRVRAGNYFYPETAGMLSGVGIRHQVYWAWWLRDEMLASAVSFLDKVGTMGLLLVYYDEGNETSRGKAEDTARKASRQNAIAVPRPNSNSSKQTAGIELIPANMGGVQFLKDFIGSYFERHIERLIVGQSLSAGTEGSGLGGSGVAGLHMDTKYNLLASDAEDMDATYTSDLVMPTCELNFPGCGFEYRFVHNVPDPDSGTKLDAVTKASSLGVDFVKDEVRGLTGMSKPEEDDETIGGQQGQGGDPNGGGNGDGQSPTGDDPDQLEAIADKLEAGEELTPDEQAIADEVLNASAGNGEEIYSAGSDWEAPADGRKYWRRKKSDGGYEYSETKPGERPDGQEATDNDPQSQQRVESAKDRIVAAHSGMVDPTKEAGQSEQKPTGVFGKIRSYGSRALDTKIGRTVMAAEHKLAIAAHKTREIAREAATARGLDADRAERLGRILAIADFAGGWIAGGATAAVAGPLAGKAVSLTLPTASALYLAYSTARNPLATWKAARKAIGSMSVSPVGAAKDFKAAWKGEQHHSLESWLEMLYASESDPGHTDAESDAAVRLADLLSNADDPDTVTALFLAALANTGHATAALEATESVDPSVMGSASAEESYAMRSYPKGDFGWQSSNSRDPSRKYVRRVGGNLQYSPSGGKAKPTTAKLATAQSPAAKPLPSGQSSKAGTDQAMRQRVEQSLGQGWKRYAEIRSENHGSKTTAGRIAESMLRQKLKTFKATQLAELIRVHSESPKDGFAEWAAMGNEFLQAMAIGFNLKPGVLIDGTDADLGLALNAKLTAASEPESKVRPGDRVKFVSHYDTLRENELVYGRVILVTNGTPEQNGLFVYYNWSDGAGKAAFGNNGDGINAPKKLCSVEEYYQRAGDDTFRDELRGKLSLSRSDHKKLRKAMDEFVISQIEETAGEVNKAADTIRKYGGDERAAEFVGKATAQLLEADSDAAFKAVAAKLGVSIDQLKALKPKS